MTRPIALVQTQISSNTLTKLQVVCGCGFRASSTDEGVAHVHETGHTLHITGEIRLQK